MELNGHLLQTIEDYQVALQGMEVGTTIKLTALRKDKKNAIKFNLIAPPANPDPDVKILAQRGPFAGVKVANLSPALAQQYNFPDSYRDGVVVVDVPSNGFGFVEMQSGDIIEEVNGKKVTDLKHLEQLMKEPMHTMAVRRDDAIITFRHNR